MRLLLVTFTLLLLPAQQLHKFTADANLTNSPSPQTKASEWQLLREAEVEKTKKETTQHHLTRHNNTNKTKLEIVHSNHQQHLNHRQHQQQRHEQSQTELQYQHHKPRQQSQEHHQHHHHMRHHQHDGGDASKTEALGIAIEKGTATQKQLHQPQVKHHTHNSNAVEFPMHSKEQQSKTNKNKYNLHRQENKQYSINISDNLSADTEYNNKMQNLHLNYNSREANHRKQNKHHTQDTEQHNRQQQQQQQQQQQHQQTTARPSLVKSPTIPTTQSNADALVKGATTSIPLQIINTTLWQRPVSPSSSLSSSSLPSGSSGAFARHPTISSYDSLHWNANLNEEDSQLMTSDVILPQYFKETEHKKKDESSASSSHYSTSNIHTEYDYYYYDSDDDDDDTANSNELKYDYDSFRGAEKNHDHKKESSSSIYTRRPRESDKDYQNDYLNTEPIDRSRENPVHGSPGTLTAQKINELGTNSAAQDSFRNFYRRDYAIQAANKHMDRVRDAIICKNPLPRVVKVSNATSKSYMPSHTILHRCGEDTGCCNTMTKVCTVKKSEEVELYFSVSAVRKRTTFEVLKLTNHTECECVDRNDTRVYWPLTAFRGKRSQEPEDYSSEDDACICPKYFDAMREEIIDSSAAVGSIMHHNYISTPSPYFKANNANCQCDCRNENLTCLRLKQGIEGFAMHDRKCIADGRCKTPTCAYGAFITAQGRCPHPPR